MIISISKKGKKYSGTSGLYCHVDPDNASKIKLAKFCNAANIGELPKDVHCTVMYSSTPIAEKVARRFSKEQYGARAHKVVWWPGHDNAGYVVLRLGCADLTNEHNRLKIAGCTPTFPVYEAHIALASPKPFSSKLEALKFCDMANAILVKEPLRLTLIDQQIEDLG